MSIKSLKELEDMKLSGKGVLVMDGDWIVFQAMAASEKEVDWGDDIWTLDCDHAKAREIVDATIKGYASRKKAWAGAPIILAFTDKVNWRKEILPTYKDNRKKTRKPVGYREFLTALWEREEYISVLEPRLEGDDVMGIIGSNPKPFGFKKAVLVSCDKDFKTIPDCDFLWCTTGKLLEQNEATANYWLMFQAMKGDMTDGYSGITGLGETGALEFLDAPYKFVQETSEIKAGKNKGQLRTIWAKQPLEEHESLWDGIVTIGAKAGMTELEVLTQARVARILRHEDYNWVDREIYLMDWNPEAEQQVL